jgi:hypothetical protein
MATSLPPPARFAGAVGYEYTDIPPQLTLAEWRRCRHEVSRSGGRLWRLLGRLLGHH